jgi:uncharacterized protein
MEEQSANRTLKRGFPWRFFTLVFGLSAPFWLANALISKLLPEIPVHLPFSSLMVVAPPFAAVICTRRENRTGNTAKLLKRAFDFEKLNPKTWFFPMMVLMPAVMFIQIGILILIQREIPPVQLSGSTILVFTLVFFISAVAEEIGWQGYAIDRLPKKWNSLTAGIFLGIIWAAWHIIPFIQMEKTPSWIIWQCLNLTVTRLIIVWIANNTQKSVSSAVLFHTTYNISTLFSPAYDPLIVTAVLILTAGIITVLWGPKTLAGKKW